MMKTPDESASSAGRPVALLLVGHFASGKSTVAMRLAERLGCQVVEVGDIVRSSAKAAGEPTFRHAEQVLTSSQPLTFAYQAGERINAIEGLVVVVGIRRPDELSLLRKIRPSLVVALSASPAIRRKRWQERQADGTRIAEVPWDERDEVERSWGLDEVMKSAEVVIDANRPIDIVVDAVEQAWRTLSPNITLGGCVGADRYLCSIERYCIPYRARSPSGRSKE